MRAPPSYNNNNNNPMKIKGGKYDLFVILFRKKKKSFCGSGLRDDLNENVFAYRSVACRRE
jgi:hypothetical protein